MTNTNGSSSSTVVTADETTTLSPEAIVGQLRALRQQIPEFTQMPVADARVLHPAAQVDPEFAHAAINTIGASETVQIAVGRSAEEMRQEENEVVRWTAVEDELRAMLKGVAAANLVRRHRLGLALLQTYSIGRQLVRNKDHAHLLPHVEGMKRLNKFGRRRAKAPAEPEPKPPQSNVK